MNTTPSRVYSMLGPRHDFILGNTDLREELDACLTEVIDWQKRDLVPNAGYKKIWSVIARKIEVKSLLQVNCLD